MKIKYFDIGVGRDGFEIQWLINEIFPKLKIKDYFVYGFEPCLEAYNSAVQKISLFQNVELYRTAIFNHEGTCKLYHAINPDGHSVYSSKNNLINMNNDYETVECCRLSHWIKNNILDFESGINILRFNIEGAEYELINDLEQNNLLKNFHIVCGNCGSDITTIAELNGYYNKFLEIIKKNKIDMFWFCWDTINDEKSKEIMIDKLSLLLGK